jgi:ABC-type arginine transport system ATPase subunit
VPASASFQVTQHLWQVEQVVVRVVQQVHLWPHLQPFGLVFLDQQFDLDR